MSSKEGVNSSKELNFAQKPDFDRELDSALHPNFRQACEFDKEKMLNFLSIELLYNIETVTIIENIGMGGKSFSIHLLEDEKGSVLASLFLGNDYGNLYLAQGVRMTKGREILQAAWNRIHKLSLGATLDYLYVNDEMEIHLDVLPVDHVIAQTICSHPCDSLKSDDLEKCKIEVLKSDDSMIYPVITLHKECFDSGLSVENYGKLIDYKVMKSYYLQWEDQVISKGEWILNNRNIAYISGLCTKEAFRNMGFCSILLNWMLMEIGACNRVAVLNYETQDLWHFYSKLGFRREYVRRRVWLKI